jgi:hypothetical protein
MKTPKICLVYPSKTPPQFDKLLAITYAGESHYLIMSNLLATEDAKAAKSYRCQLRS